MRIVGYTPAMADEWDGLVAQSPQGTFLHRRGYMDYHADRFADHSLLAYDSKGRLVGALPACASGDIVTSHAGLTYGGWLTDSRHVDATAMLDMMTAASRHLADEGFKQLIYKPVPTIYHRYPAQDDLYALFRLGAVADAVGVSSAIDLSAPLTFNSNASRSVNYATNHGVTIAADGDIEPFMRLLEALLEERYNVRPVHTVDEMRLLMGRFPDNIRFYGAYHDGQLVAGVVMYMTHTVAHAQYIGASPLGRKLKALPKLFEYLIGLYSGTCRYFDFGISTEDGGRVLNEGLQRQKAGMGGRGVVYQRYRLNL